MNIQSKTKSLQRIKDSLDYNGYITDQIEIIYKNHDPIVGFYFLGKLDKNYHQIGYYNQIVKLYIYCKYFNKNTYYFLTNGKIIDFTNCDEHLIFSVKDYTGVESKICDDIISMILLFTHDFDNNSP